MSLLYLQYEKKKKKKTFVCSESQMLEDLNAERLRGKGSKTKISEYQSQ